MALFKLYEKQTWIKDYVGDYVSAKALGWQFQIFRTKSPGCISTLTDQNGLSMSNVFLFLSYEDFKYRYSDGNSTERATSWKLERMVYQNELSCHCGFVFITRQAHASVRCNKAHVDRTYQTRYLKQKALDAYHSSSQTKLTWIKAISSFLDLFTIRATGLSKLSFFSSFIEFNRSFF